MRKISWNAMLRHVGFSDINSIGTKRSREKPRHQRGEEAHISLKTVLL
jgi:hypothetical protein